MPGSSGSNNDGGYRVAGGGLVFLTVTGELKLDGIAESTGDWAGRNPGWNDEANVGPGGTLNIRAGTLSGSGQIRAHGLERSYNSGADINYWGHSGGGRIAIRLTGENATFANFNLANITAKGGSRTGQLNNQEALNKDPTGGATTNRFSSAGTIYLQTASQAEGAGDIIIRNDNNPLNQIPVTVIPALTYGGLDDDLSKASLFIEDCARVKLAASFQLVAFRSQPGTNLDLNGKTLAVSYCTLGGKPLIQKGAFSAAQLLDMGFAGVTDTSLEQTGLLEIKPFPTLFIVR